MSNLLFSLSSPSGFWKKPLFIIFFFVASLVALKLSATKPDLRDFSGLSEGDIMFVAYNGDGDDGFAIVALVAIPANSTIYFNENEWNGLSVGGGGAFTSNTEGEITWSTGGSEITAGTVVIFDEVDNAGNTNYGASVGTITGTFALGTSNEVIYAFVGTDDETPTAFLSAIANDEFNATNGELTNTGLAAGVDAVNIDGDEDIMAYTGSTICNGTQAQCAAQIANLTNWTTQDATGDQDADLTTPDFPDDVPVNFTGSFFNPDPDVGVSITSQTNVDCNGQSTGSLTATATPGVANYSFVWSNGATPGGGASLTSTNSGLVAGTYTVTVTDGNGSTATASATLTQPTALVASASVTSAITCNGADDGALTASQTGGTAPYTYSWNNGGTAALENHSISAATYTVTVTDANGCTSATSVAITEPAALVASASLDNNVSINGGSDGGATASGSGGTTPYTYSWNNGATSATITGQVAGTYTVSVTDNNGCGPATSEVTITEPTAVSVSTVTDANVSCNGGSDGGATASGSGGVTPYTYLWNNGSTNASINGSVAGTYTVTLVDANGATATNTSTITQPTTLGVSASVDQNVSINGGSDGGATASGSGGTGAYTYAWSNGATSSTISGAVAGTYTVSVTDANGCGPATDQVTITEPTAVSVSTVTDANVNCNGGSDGGATASGSGGTMPYTYVWNNGSTNASISGSVAGTYTVTLVDANGATATNTSTITQPTALGASATVDQNVSINGGSDGGATASGSGGTSPYTYTWSNGATNASITGSVAGTYTVSITDANGCGPATDQVTITEPTAVSVSTVTDANVNCNGGSDGVATASGSGGVMPYTYLWNNGSTNATISGSVAGTYTVTLVDANGATATNTSTITQPTALVASASVTSAITCNGADDGALTASQTGGTAPYTYSWNNGGTAALENHSISAATYTVTVTDANGCTSATSVAITEPAALVASAFVSSAITCNGADDGALTASQTGGTAPYTYSWNNGGTAALENHSISAATYSVTVTDANGCTSATSVAITEPAALVASASLDNNVSINGGSDGGATASANGGTSPHTYVWNNGSTNASITGAVAGTYTVSITDANGCGPATDQVTITEPTAVSVSTVTDANVSCNGGSDGGATASGSGGVTPYTYLWNNGSTNASINGSVAGTYTVTLVDANGATATNTSTITQPTALSAAAVVDQNVSVNGGSDGGATASGSGGTGAYTYAWSNGATSSTISGTVAGTYTVSVTDANGCGPATDQVTITEPTAVSVSTVTNANVSCNGGSDGGATASGSGGTMPYTYVWNNGSTNASISGSVAGTYTVTLVDANGATATNTSTITQPTALGASATVDQNVSINGGSDGGATASGSGGTSPYTYTWSNGATNASITGAVAGTYTVSITDANGCGPATDQVTITEPTAVSVSTVTDANVSCNGGSDGGATASGSGGTMPYTYLWNNGSTNATISGSVAGTYTVTLVDANGATATNTSTITQPTALSAAAVLDQNVSVNGGSDGGATASGSGGTGAYTYAWSNGATSSTISGAVAGTYTVSVTDANGCGPATDQVTITEPTVVVAFSSVDNNVSCNGGSDGGATASASGGISPYTYSWSNAATSSTISGTVAGTYTVTVTDNNGATATSQSTITEPTALTGSAVVDQNVSINGGSDGGATASGSGGTGAYTYAWSNGATNASITGAVAGTYTVSITDANGCGPATDQVTITEPTAVVASSSVDNNVSCNGGSDGGATASASGGISPYTYSWSNAATSSTISGTVAGTYTVTVTDNNGATATSQSTITEPTALTGSAVVDQNVSINGGSDGGATASGSGGTGAYTYAWSNGATNASITGAVAGTYTVSITDANGCGPATDQVTITEPTAVVASSSVDNNVSCNGGSDGGATASASGGISPYTYSWSNAATSSTISGTAAGTYTVTVTDNNGATATSQSTITEPDALIANASTDMNVSTFGNMDGAVSSSPTGGTPPFTYLWSNGATNSAASSLAAGTYTVTVTDANGCTASQSTTVTQPPNSDPEFDSEPITEIGDNEIYTYFVETSDADDHTINLVGTTLPSWLSLEPEVFALSTFVGQSFEPVPFDIGTILAEEPKEEPTALLSPFGMAFDSAGDLFIADSDRNQIMKVSTEGFVSVFVGSGSSGTSDGTGTDASFYQPLGLVIDDNDNLYVTDSGNDAIRKITANGVVSTLATLSTGSSAGTGSGSEGELFGRIFGITIDDSGNLYVTSPVFHKIFKVTPGGVESTFAGSGFKSGTGPFEGEIGDGTFADGSGTGASFNSPFGIDIDSQGNLYVADGFNGRVRKITSAGTVTTLVGSGFPFFSEAEVADSEGSGIPLSGGTGTDAVFFGVPTGLRLDNDDNIYLTQGFNSPSVLRIIDGNVLETILGGITDGFDDGIGTDAQFTQPFDVEIDAFGDLFISESFTGSVRKAKSGNALIGDPTDEVGDHLVVIDASDGNGGTAQQAFTITVSDNTAPEFESGTAANFAENGTSTVYTAQATDTNSKATVTYHLGQGMDSQFFVIDPSSGILTFLSPPDFENPQDGGTDNTYKVEIHASDDAQNSSDAFVVTINVTDVQEDITPPDKPIITGISDDTGSSNSDGITNDENITISGTAEPMSTVEVFTQYGPLRNTQADVNGDWILDVTDITIVEVVVNLTAEAVDAAGNRSATSDVFVLTPDFTAPAKPMITGISEDTGSSDSDGITKDENITISGTAEPMSTVEVFTQYGPLRNTQADGNGDWILDVTDITIVEVVVNLTAEAVDAAGNRSATSDIFKLTPDFTAPAKPMITGISDDTGSSNSDGVTSDKNIMISGTAEPMSTVEIFTQYGPLRNTQADGNGDWILDVTDITIVEVVVNLTAEAVDAAGNRSATSDIFKLTPDFTAPAKPVITSISDDTGSSNSDGVTSDKNITISGTAEPMSTVEVFTQYGPIRSTQADTNGDWLLDITDITLFELVVDLTAEAVDLAGNRSATSDIFKLTPDFTAPAKPVITSISDDTGSSDSDGVTSDKNITISGTAEPMSTVEVFTQYGPIRSTQADTNGDWLLDITDITLFELVVDLTAEAVDLAGNRSATSDVFVLTPDFTAPGVTIDISNNSAAGYTITALFDEPVGGLTLGDITVSGGIASNLVEETPGTYSFLVSSTLSSADVQINANAVEDLAGNGNTASNQLNLGFTPVSAQEEFRNLRSLNKTEEVSVYPNPASNVLNFDLSELSAEAVDIYMYNGVGTPVFSRKAYKEKTLTLDVSDYTNGMYIVQFYDGQQVIIKKVMVKK